MKNKQYEAIRGKTQKIFPQFRLLFYLLFLMLCLYQTTGYALPTKAYKVGPSDILRIRVLDKEAIDEAFPISCEGTINFPLLGNIYVSGLTVKQIEKKLTDLLGKDYLVNPQVYVSIEKYNSQKVIVWGEVKSQGSYVLTGETSLLEIISEADGITDKAGRKIMLFRNAAQAVSDPNVAETVKGMIKKKDPIIIDLDQLVKKGDRSKNLLVLAGDVIVVEAKKDWNINEQRVYITGCVSKPGAYEYQNGLTALSLCIIAGGVTNRGDLNKATLIRNIAGEDKIYKIDLDKIKNGKAIDFKLKPGDRVNVPESFW